MLDVLIWRQFCRCWTCFLLHSTTSVHLYKHYKCHHWHLYSTSCFYKFDVHNSITGWKSRKPRKCAGSVLRRFSSGAQVLSSTECCLESSFHGWIVVLDCRIPIGWLIFCLWCSSTELPETRLWHPATEAARGVTLAMCQEAVVEWFTKMLSIKKPKSDNG